MISIVIPSLNSPHIKKIVEALKRETHYFKDVEVIIVGKDKLGLLHDEKNIIFIDTGHPVSPAVSRNIGLNHTHGETIIFLDSDCIPRNGWFRYLLAARRDGKDVVGGAIEFREGTFWELADNIIHFYGSHFSRKGDIIDRGPLPTANLCISRKAVEDVGLFSEDLITGEDFEYSMRLREKGYILNFERRAKVVHLTGRSNVMEVLRHSASWAKNSIHLRNRFSHLLNTPWIMKKGVLLYLFSPVVAWMATMRIFFTSRALLRYWYTVPVIYLAKLIWSVTAAMELLYVR